MSDKVRVLQLASPSGLYGAERWILALMKHLDRTRTECLVAAVRDAPEATAPVCTQARLNGFPAFVLEAPGRFSFAAVFQLVDLVKRQSVDIVHAHGYKTDVLGLLAARIAGCKIVSTPHGWTSAPDFKLRLYESFDRRLFMLLDAVVPLSQGILDSVASVPFLSGKLRLIANGVDLGEVSAPLELPAAIASLRARGKLVIGSIGRLTAGKGLDVALRALAGHGSPDWHLVVIGEGDQGAALRALAGDLGIAGRVDFLGFREDRLAFLHGFDVFVLPSLSEGTPRCVMEAMAARVPVVATDIPGCRNLVRHEETGLLFRPGDPGALADAIRRVASSPERRSEWVRNAHASVTARHSAARMADEYAALYAEILGR